jgi:hypothetical protein
MSILLLLQRLEMAKLFEAVTCYLPSGLGKSSSRLFQIDLVEELLTEGQEYILDQDYNVRWTDYVHLNRQIFAHLLTRAIDVVWSKTLNATILAILQDKTYKPSPTRWEVTHILKVDLMSESISISKWAKCNTLEARTQMMLDVMELYRGYWRILSRTPKQAEKYQGLSEVQKLMAKAGYKDWLFKP